MPRTPSQLLSELRTGSLPPVILIGGNNEYLIDQTFHAVREMIGQRAPSTSVEVFSESVDLVSVLDSFRTFSLFAAPRLLVLPEVNAFVTRKEVAALYDKAVADWTSAKTDRKRSSSLAKLLHVLGLVGIDLDAGDGVIAAAIGARTSDPALQDMLAMARATGRKSTRGEGDAALLVEAITRGGSPSTTLLMKTAELPKDSTTVAMIDRVGKVAVCNMSREEVANVIEKAVAGLADELDVRFDPPAVKLLQQKLGIDRILQDKFSHEVPDVRVAIGEAERLGMFVGRGGRVTAKIVDEQIASVGGGARYELGSLFSEGKISQTVAKLRDLVAQSKRDDPKTPGEIHFGKFLFPLADEIRQMIGIHSYARVRKIDLGKGMPYMRFKDLLAEPLSEYLKERELVKQKPHPFALHKRFEAAKNHKEAELFEALAALAELEFSRKCGGVSAESGLESFLLGARWA